METHKGTAVAQGIAIGPAYVFKSIKLDALIKNKLPIADDGREADRLEKAVAASIAQLTRIKEEVGQKAGAEAGDIFDSHLQILQDRGLLQKIKTSAALENANIEYVLALQIEELRGQFNTIKDELIRSRFVDVQDVYDRLLRNLLDIEHVRVNPLKRISTPVIFIAERLIPSDIALLEPDKLRGIIIEEGSRTSHVAIIAQSLGIPTLINVPGISARARTDDTVIMDGSTGTVLLHPTSRELQRYGRRQRTLARERSSAKRSQARKCLTTDGLLIRLEANVNTAAEAKRAREMGAEGIGLLRSEFFYLFSPRMPTPDEETAFYKKTMRLMKGAPVTVRLLDIGADKAPPYLRLESEENPQLGLRGIRWLLRNPSVLMQQLRSLLRASHDGPVRILAPFVSLAEEVRSFKDIVEAVCAREGIAGQPVKIGIMIEIPSIAYTPDAYLDLVDFVSIGTNDLVQYMFAAHRNGRGLDEYRAGPQPVILALLKSIAERAGQRGKEVIVCGEMAADARIAKLLIGLGIRILSMQPDAIPRIKRELSAVSTERMKIVAEQAIGCSTMAQVNDLLDKSRL
jgi:phosphotransferase system enzyme I (PtsI)